MNRQRRILVGMKISEKRQIIATAGVNMGIGADIDTVAFCLGGKGVNAMLGVIGL